MTIYYLILGVNKNQKYIYLSFILLALAFLAKYSAILILPLMILYPLFKGDFKVIKKYFKTYVIGGLLAVAVNIPFLLYLISIGFFDNALNPFIRLGGGTTGLTGKIPSAFTETTKFFYITNLDKFIASYLHSVAILLIIIAVIGFIIIFYKNKYLFNKISKNKNLGLLIIGVILIILGFLSVEYVSNLINIGLISLGILCISIFLNGLLNNSGANNESIFNLNFDILMLYWFLIYLVFFSAILPRLERYAIPLLLPLAFFIALGFKGVLETSLISNLSNNKFKLDFSKIIPLIFIILLVFSAITVADKNHNNYQTEVIEDLCHYLEEYDSDFNSKKIWSFYGGASSFYLKYDIHNVPFSIESGGLNQDQIRSLGNKMYNKDVDYFISIVNNYNIPHYKILKKIGKGAIYIREN